MNTAVRFSVAVLRRAALVCVLGFSVQAAAQSPAPLALPDIDLVEQGVFSAAARQPDGGTIVAGLFASVNGIARRDLVRLRPDGTLDPDWNAQIQGYVTAIVADAVGNLYVGGGLQGPPPDLRSLRLAKLSPDGVFDAAWAPEPDAIVECLALDGAGSIYVFGRDLSLAGGLPTAGIAKLSTTGNGVADPAWDLGGRTDGFVRTIAANANGVYVGGQFTEIGGRARLNLAKFSNTGAVDSSWRPEPNYDVFALATIGGSVYVGGGFTQFGAIPVRGLAKLSGIGSAEIDTSWNPPVDDGNVVRTLAVDHTGSLYAGGGLAVDDGYRITMKVALSDGALDNAWNPSVSGYVNAIAAGNGDTVVLGGGFDGIGDEQRLSLAALNANGALLPAVDLEHSAEVYAVAGQPDGGIVVGGRFHRANGIVRRNLLRIAADGTLDPDWNPMADGYVYALAVDQDGTVFAGGGFRQISGLASPYLAKLAAGGIGAADAAWSPRIDSTVTTLTFDDNRKLYVGGQFGYAGTLERRRLARLSPDGTGAVDDWNPAIGGGGVSTVAIGHGALYAAGGFDSVGGTARNRIAKISTDTGALDIDWNPSIVGYVGALALAEDETLYIGGYFSSVDGMPLSSFARLRPDGEPDATWKPFVDEPYTSSIVNALILDDAGGIYVGGSFDRPDAISAKRLERYFVNGNGTADPTWNPLPNGAVNALGFAGDGTLLVGGSHTAYGNSSRNGVAALPRSDTFFADGFEVER